MLKKVNQKKLLEIAKCSIEEYIKNASIAQFEIKEEELQNLCGAFVTLYVKGELRGCIGRITSDLDPLWMVVRDMAIEACASDYRFHPIEEKELDFIEIEISVLSSPRKINDWTEIELGKHGVIVKKDYSSGVFLPQVAVETGWSKEEFLEHLCRDKGGLDLDAYKNDLDVDLYVFEVQVIN